MPVKYVSLKCQGGHITARVVPDPEESDKTCIRLEFTVGADVYLTRKGASVLYDVLRAILGKKL